MFGKYKVFSKDLFEENDRKAKNAAIKYFSKQFNYRFKDNPDQYGVDLEVYTYDNRFLGFMEVEVKKGWINDTFNHEDVQIPERKKKFTKIDHQVVFVVISGYFTHGIWFTKDVLISSPLQEIKNKYNPFGEFFYKVPLDKVHFFEIK